MKFSVDAKGFKTLLMSLFSPRLYFGFSTGLSLNFIEGDLFISFDNLFYNNIEGIDSLFWLLFLYSISSSILSLKDYLEKISERVLGLLLTKKNEL